jgi:hypothetical protein
MSLDRVGGILSVGLDGINSPVTTVEYLVVAGGGGAGGAGTDTPATGGGGAGGRSVNCYKVLPVVIGSYIHCYCWCWRRWRCCQTLKGSVGGTGVSSVFSSIYRCLVAVVAVHGSTQPGSGWWFWWWCWF